MRKVVRRLGLILLLFIASLVMLLAILAGIRNTSRGQLLNDTQASFRVIAELVADGVTTGYFKWTEFRDAVATDQQAVIQSWLDEVPTAIRFVRSAIIEEQAPPEVPYRLLARDGVLVVECQIADSKGEQVLRDRRALVFLDADAILAKVQAAPSIALDPNGIPFIYGLNCRFNGAPLTGGDLALAIGLAVLISLISLIVFRREDRFFYEAKGLDTIIFLFEHTERYSANHSRHVADLTVALGKRMGFRGRRLKDLRTAALLHDIGKIAVPRDVLTKPGALSVDEFANMRTHADASARILEYFAELAHLAPIVRSHHEKMDGSGYPLGLKGTQIPLEGRIIAVADVFEALTGERPYRSPFDMERAVQELRSMPLDQDIVEVLAAHIAAQHGKPVFFDR